MAQRRKVPPYGMAGRALADGTVTEVAGRVIEIPVGSGHGPSSTRHPQQAGEETNDLRAF
ncbi:hypothetical protein [Streptomyces sp. NBC_00285]|uniref:hypothetical protein n=1 Tax=Streptomyces sp. NBC_00285 TaxID=2975700 RepID=UPI002E2E7081|nr:hypothetical protein [Streptomyces sp. NBC_00285]